MLAWISNYISTLNQPSTPTMDIESDSETIKINTISKLQTVHCKDSIGVNTIQYIEDLDCLIIADISGHLSLWSCDGYKKLASIKLHEREIGSIKYYPKKRMVFTVGLDCFVKVVYISPTLEMNVVKSFKEFDIHGTGLEIIEKLGLLVTCGWDEDIRVRDLKNLEQKASISTNGKDKMGSKILYLEKHNAIVVGFYNRGCLGVYDLTTGEEICTALTGYSHCNLNSISYDSENDLIMARVDYGRIRCWQYADRTLKYKKEITVSGMPAVYQVDGLREFIVSQDKQLSFFDPETRKMTVSQDIDIEKPTGLAYDAKHKNLIVGDSKSSKISIYKCK
jgi:WD40 repeat protein